SSLVGQFLEINIREGQPLLAPERRDQVVGVLAGVVQFVAGILVIRYADAEQEQVRSLAAPRPMAGPVRGAVPLEATDALIVRRDRLYRGRHPAPQPPRQADNR